MTTFMRTSRCNVRFEADFWLSFLVVLGSAVNMLPFCIEDSSFFSFSGFDGNISSDLKSINVQAPLIGCVAATVPVLLDLCLDYFSSRPELLHLSSYHFIPKRSMFLAVTLPDLIILLVLIPYDQYSCLSGLINARDSLIICTFLSYMNKVSPEIFSRNLMIFVGACFQTLNIMDTLSYYIDDERWFNNLYIIIFCILGVVALVLGYMYKKLMNNIREKGYKRFSLNDNICHTYAAFFPLYIAIDWYFPTSMLQAVEDEKWTTFGQYFMTTYSSVLLFCAIGITILISRISREELLQYSVKASSSTSTNDPNNHLNGFISNVIEIQLSCESAVNILNDLIIYEGLEAENIELIKSGSQIQRYLNNQILEWERKASETNVILQVRYTAPSKSFDWSCAYIDVDEAKFNRVLHTLISNAIECTKHVVEVHICIRDLMVQSRTQNNDHSRSHTTGHRHRHSNDQNSTSSTSMMCIEVTDFGPGMSEDDQNKLFKDALRFTSGVLQTHEGLGLGLSISHRLMVMHGGNLSVHSEGVDRGCTYTVSLPFRVETQKHSLRSSSSRSMSRSLFRMVSRGFGMTTVAAASETSFRGYGHGLSMLSSTGSAVVSPMASETLDRMPIHTHTHTHSNPLINSNDDDIYDNGNGIDNGNIPGMSVKLDVVACRR
eukprot:gene9280-19259_t